MTKERLREALKQSIAECHKRGLAGMAQELEDALAAAERPGITDALTHKHEPGCYAPDGTLRCGVDYVLKSVLAKAKQPPRKW